MSKTFTEIFREELGHSTHYSLTDQPGPGVLLVNPSLRDIVSRVPPEEPVGRSRIWVDSVGDATLVVDLVDATTGATLGSATDRRTAKPAGTIGNFGAVPSVKPATMAEVRRLARRWAMQPRQTAGAVVFRGQAPLIRGTVYLSVFPFFQWEDR